MMFRRILSALIAVCLTLAVAGSSYGAFVGPRRVLMSGQASSGPVVQPLRSAVSRAMVGQGFVSGLNGTYVQGQTRMRMYLGDASLSELHVCYGNWANQSEGVGPGNLTVEAALEDDAPLGVAHFLWSGNTTITLTPGQTACSDALLPSALGLTVFPANAAMWFRTGDTAVSSVGHPYSNLLSATGESMWAGPAFTSQVNATGPMTQPSGGAAASGGLTPFAVTGRYTVPMPSLCDIGDSISAGINDTAITQQQGQLAGNGYVGRAAYAAGNSGGGGSNIYPVFKLGIGGDSIVGGGYAQRATFFQYCTHGVAAFGTNDLTGGSTAAAVLSASETLWNTMAADGISYIWQAPVIPRTTSTDGWLTEANQTPISAAFQTGGQRDILNTGFTNAVGTNHLTGVLNFLGDVQASDNEALWIVNSTTYTPNVTVTSGTAAFTFSTGSFTSANVGQNITIAGAGTSGGILTTTIATVGSTTSITTAANAGTGLTAQAETVSYGTTDYATSDGIHPLGNIHALMAPVLLTALQSAGPQLPTQNNTWVPSGVDWAMDFQNNRYYGINCAAWLCYPLISANNGINRNVAAYGVTANNSTGTLIEFAPNTARVTPGRGLLAEKAATNLFTTPFSPATQTATVANSTQYTISVYGTGSLTLSGACTGTASAGSPVTCTTSSTSLTATISGTLLSMQCETGAVATSPISGTRIAEDVGFPASLLNNVTYPTGTFIMAMEGIPNGPPYLAAFGSDYLISMSTTTFETNKTAALLATLGAAANGHTVVGFAWDGTGRGLDGNGGTIVTDANGTSISTNGTQLYLGGQGSGGGDSTLNSYIQRIVHFPTRLTGSTTPTFQQATAP